MVETPQPSLEDIERAWRPPRIKRQRSGYDRFLSWTRRAFFMVWFATSGCIAAAVLADRIIGLKWGFGWFDLVGAGAMAALGLGAYAVTGLLKGLIDHLSGFSVDS